MVLPIYGYGEPVLRKKAEPITSEYPELKTLIANMFETMYNAYGVGLAAPQIGLPIRLFIVDTEPFSEGEEFSDAEKLKLKEFKKVFINAKITNQEGNEWPFNEGCLSIPDVREDVSRKEKITITYQDEHFKTYTEVYEGLIARVIQHEYDHIEGVLFIDHISTFRRTLIKKRLTNIMEGKVRADYKMKFAQKKGR
jgi:peptide deformylase